MRATAARQASLREHNLGLVLRTVLEVRAAHQPPRSRADVAAATGLAKATVSALVDQLVAGGLLAELAPAAPQRAGRPAVPLTAPTGTLAAIGAEVNVDYLGVRALDLAGTVLDERLTHADLRGSAPDEVLSMLGTLVEQSVAALAGGPRLVGTALALPGLVDRTTGILRLAPNLGWRDVDVARILAQASPTLAANPPLLANEADLAARAEAAARVVPGGDRPSFVYVSGEIGVGAALVLDGALFAGRHGWAGEVGHIVVAEGRTLEQVAGQDAMLSAAGLSADEGLEALVAAADRGEPRAGHALATAGAALGLALANVVNVIDVSDVVLGGTYARLARWLTEPVLVAMRDRVLAAPWAEPRVDVALAAPLPAMTGAALAQLGRVLADPVDWLADPAEPADHSEPVGPTEGAAPTERGGAPVPAGA
ncbi:ROK family transcriptional regulator [Cellulomonas gelida]|uniref:Transcriptional regulator n=1 Tax=Cellulomonas gelida TaxID=1712 RepID=A0A4Y3KJH7_9CELL|nr:ROK family transcriptional regulator [Cellulomonas gelida]GEA84571.1 transcriptional regulator [Cellulomonas gelida]GGL17671.1 transcriptional regulator [Cellulomonas gelida]